MSKSLYLDPQSLSFASEQKSICCRAVPFNVLGFTEVIIRRNGANSPLLGAWVPIADEAVLDISLHFKYEALMRHIRGFGVVAENRLDPRD